MVAGTVTRECNDSHQLLPMISAIEVTLEAAGVQEGTGLVLADASYWSEANATAKGP